MQGLSGGLCVIDQPDGSLTAQARGSLKQHGPSWRRLCRPLATSPKRPPRPIGSAVLTDQERTVASLAAEGMANADIARSLGISERTVAHHLQHVYAKLKIAGRHHLPRHLGTHDASQIS